MIESADDDLDAERARQLEHDAKLAAMHDRTTQVLGGMGGRGSLAMTDEELIQANVQLQIALDEAEEARAQARTARDKAKARAEEAGPRRRRSRRRRPRLSAGSPRRSSSSRSSSAASRSWRRPGTVIHDLPGGESR